MFWNKVLVVFEGHSAVVPTKLLPPTPPFFFFFLRLSLPSSGSYACVDVKRSPGKKAESVICPHPPQKLCADELLLRTMLNDRVSLKEVLNFLVSLSIIPSDY